MIHSQGLQLQQIEGNPGLLPVKEGQALISHDKWTVVKILNLELIYNQLEFNIKNYLDLKEQVRHFFDITSFDSDFINVELQTEYAMNTTIEKYQQLNPSLSRTKRGLINPLGSIIKIITGNMDNDDALRFEKLISDVNNKQDKLSRKMTIVTEMVGVFSNVSHMISNNFIQIEKVLNDLTISLNETKWIQVSNKIIHTYNIFVNNFQTLYIRLNEIETAIAFAKIDLLHQSIVDTTELIRLLQDIEKVVKLVYPVNIENIIKIEQCIQLKAYVKQNQIKFIMHIPLIRDDPYNYFILYPIPVFNRLNNLTTLILPQNPYLLVKGSDIKPLSQSCKSIDEELYLCYENDNSPITEDRCVADLMKFSANITSCHPFPVSLDDVKAYIIQPNRWILYARTETLMTKHCENEISQENLIGTYLLSMDDNCSVQIRDIKIRRHQSRGIDVTYADFPVMKLPKILTTASDFLQKPVIINSIELGDIRLLNNLLQKAESESGDSDRSYNASAKYISLGNSVFCVVIGICIIIAYKSRIKKWVNNIVNRDYPPSADNLNLGEGGVMLSVPHTVPRI